MHVIVFSCVIISEVTCKPIHWAATSIFSLFELFNPTTVGLVTNLYTFYRNKSRNI